VRRTIHYSETRSQKVATYDLQPEMESAGVAAPCPELKKEVFVVVLLWYGGTCWEPMEVTIKLGSSTCVHKVITTFL
jgi:hypothetical protein